MAWEAAAGAGALEGVQDPFLFRREPLLDLLTHLFGHPLDFPRFHVKPRVAAQIFGGLLKLGLATGPRHESAHAGRIGGLDHVQKLVVGKASLATEVALVKRAREGHRAQGG